MTADYESITDDSLSALEFCFIIAGSLPNSNSLKSKTKNQVLSVLEKIRSTIERFSPPYLAPVAHHHYSPCLLPPCRD